MKNLLAFILLMAAFAGSTHAISAQQVAATEPARGPRQTATAPTGFPGEMDMQAVCREIVVATDEGYGITDHVTRFVCEETR